MIDELPFSKAKQTATSPNARCDHTGELKRQCPCPRCRGARNQRKGVKGQKAVRKALGIRPERFAGQLHHEESWRSSHIRWESKAGQQVRAIATAYIDARAQSDHHRAIGDNRPFAMTAEPDGSMPLVIVRADELGEFVAALIEEWTK